MKFNLRLHIALIVLLAELTAGGCRVSVNSVHAPPSTPVANAGQTPPATPHAFINPRLSPSTQKASHSLPANGRAPLADYIPCRFTDNQETFLYSGYTPPATENPTDAAAQALAEDTSLVKPENKDAFLKLYYRNRGKSPERIIDAAVKASLVSAKDKDAAVAALDTGTLDAPTDVSCSQSMLSWNETYQIFGRAVADRYVAFQVNVRNLNPSQQFLVHDVQVAVIDECVILANADDATRTASGCGNGCPPGANCRSHFLSGRDRKLVQGVAERGQQTSPRNVTARVLDALGSLFGNIATATGGPSLSDAVHVFTAGFIPGFKAVYPDFTIAQLNRLNDIAFSADTAYKLVVGIKGAAPIVTFISSDIFAARYKAWTPAQKREFQHESVVVIAGTHIIETNDTLQSSKIACPQTGSYLDFTAAKNGKLTCTVTGTNLDKLSTLILRSSVDSNDVSHAEAAATPNADKTSATADFTLTDLTALASSTYTIFTVDAAGAERATAFTLNMPPTVTTITTTQTPLSVATCSKPCKLTIVGGNLDAITAINLVTADTNHTVVAALAMDPSKDPKMRAPTLSSTEAAKLKLTGTTSYQLQLTAGTGTFIPDAQVSLTQ